MPEKISSDQNSRARSASLCKKQYSVKSNLLSPQCISETLHAQEHFRLSQSGVKVFSTYHFYEYYSRQEFHGKQHGFLLFVFAVVRVFFFFFFFFFEYAKGGGKRVVGDFITIIVVGRTLRFAKRRRDTRERQFFAFHRNNTNERW